jgi:hypothetical protein
VASRGPACPRTPGCGTLSAQAAASTAMVARREADRAFEGVMRLSG